MEFNAAVRLFDRYLEGELTEVQRNALEEFLETDEACAAELARYRRVHDVVHAYFNTVRPGEGFVEDVMVGVEEAESPRKRRRSHDRRAPDDGGSGNRWPLIAAIVVLLAIAGGAYVMFGAGGSGAAEVVFVTRGAERLVGAGVGRDIAVGDRLAAGDSVRANGGDVRLLLADRTEVTVGENGILQIGADASTPHTIKTGLVRFIVFDGDGRFQVDFNAGSASVLESVNGESRFSVTVPESESEATTVDVTRGTVRLATDRGSQDVGTGMRSAARKNAAPSRPVAIRSKKPESQRDRNRVTRNDGGRSARTQPANRNTGNPDAATAKTPATSGKVSLDDTLAKLRDAGATPEATRAELQKLTTNVVGERKEEVRLLLVDILRQDPDESVRREAYTRLAALGAEGLFDDSVDVLQNDESIEVRRLALAKVAQGKDPEEVRRVLGDALLASYPQEMLPLKHDVLQAFVKVVTPDDLQILLDLAQTDDGSGIMKSALEAVGQVRSPDAVDALLPFLRDPDEAVRTGAVSGLRRLTGKSLGYDPKGEPDLRDEAANQWEAWWSENRDTFEF